jgi:hypothetical protein
MVKQLSTYRFFILLLICIPLFFLNIRVDQSWGDDFAQYIHQAINLVEGKPQFETGYIYNENYPMLGPKSYTVGFPLILAPTIALFGNDMLMLNYLMTAFLALTFIVMSSWLLNYFRWQTAVFLSLICIYNPWMIYFKAEINSEIPFTFFIMLFLFVYNSKSFTIDKILLLGLIGGVITSIRPIGAVIVVAYALEGIINYYLRHEKEKRVFLTKSVYVPIIGLASFFLLNYFIFPVSSGMQAGNQMRTSLFSFDFEQLTKNLGVYFELLQRVFQTSNQSIWWFLSILLSSFFVAFCCLGFIEGVRSRMSAIEIFVLLYMFVLLFYTYSSAGFRFLMPLAPLMFYYFGMGVKLIESDLSRSRFVIPVAVLAIVLVFKQDWPKFRKVENTLQFGPYQTDVITFFESVKREVPKDAVVLFKKPRALSLYTDRTSFSNNPYEDLDSFKAELSKHSISYLILSTGLPNPPLDEFILAEPNRVQLVNELATMKLYKLK